MTSSSRALRSGQRRWEPGRHRAKGHDPFCEPGLVSILFLACGRPWITRRSLRSTAEALAGYPGEVEWIFVENGRCPTNLVWFESFRARRKVIVRHENFGITHGLNQAWMLSRGEHCMIHENDWECGPRRDFLSLTRDILDERPEVGIVQLRAVRDPRENWGLGKPEYSPWSCSHAANAAHGITVTPETTRRGHAFSVARFPNGFNHNPMVMRKSLYRACGPLPEVELGADPRDGETAYQARIAATGCAIAHVGLELYYHIGQQATPIAGR